MTITGPYEFNLYSMDEETVATIKKAGLEPPRMIHNDGSVPIAGMIDGERSTVLWVSPVAPRAHVQMIPLYAVAGFIVLLFIGGAIYVWWPK